MKVVFMGSGQFACPAVGALLRSSKHRLAGVVSQPDRPKGRSLHPAPCPVKAMVAEKGVPVITPETLKTPDVIDVLLGWKADIFVVAAYGLYVPKNITAIPSRGTINIHPSLLPKYRGAAPIQWSVAEGEKMTGVTILYVSEKMDAGDIVLQQEHPIDDEDTAATLEPRLAESGAELLMRALDLMETGHVHRIPQDDVEATYARKLTKEDGRVDWSIAAEAIRNRVRGFQPWPGSYCEAPRGSGHLLKILKTRVEEASGSPGQVLSCDGDGPLVGTGRRALRLIEVQPEGRKAMPGSAYLCGHKMQPGDVMG